MTQNPFAPPQYASGPVSKPTSTLAVVALVLGFFLAPIGIVLGVVALVRVRRTGDGGKGLAIGAIGTGVVVSGLVTALLVAGSQGAFDGAFDGIDLPYEHTGTLAQAGSSVVGTCLRSGTLPDDPSTVVDCDRKHDQEVSYVGSLPGGDYPGDDAVADAADGICVSTFRSYVGTSWHESEFDWDFYAPDLTEWEDGRRQVVCVVIPGVDYGSDTLDHGTVRDSNA